MLAGLIGAAAGGVGVALAGAPAGTAVSPPQRAMIEAVVRDYILDHPEIIPEAVERLQQRQVAKQVAANRQAIVTPYAGAWAGNPAGDVVLVEYFDYNCGYCRRSVAEIDRLLGEDKSLKVVFKELPVLGPASDAAARLSLAAAAQGQGKFMALHRAFYAAGPLTPAKVTATARPQGVSAPAGAEGEREIARNLEVARALQVSGTPTFVVGDQVLAGAVGYDALKAAVAKARGAKR